MLDTINELLNCTDSQLLAIIAFSTFGLFLMRVCDWAVIFCKTLHDWISSLFPTNIDRK